uniref:Maltase n=1 Tax=Syphacia muris TaxID=451379 RepID=A0A0N5AK16_9BILA
MWLWNFAIISVLFPLINTDTTVDYHQRIDCFPEPGATEQKCLARDCIWESTSHEDVGNVPACFYPQTTGLFLLSAAIDKPEWILIKEQFPKVYNNPSSSYGPDIQLVRFTARRCGAALNIRIEPRDQQFPRFEPDIDIDESCVSSSTEYLELITNQEIVNETFMFSIVRNTTGTKLWDTSIGGLMFADKFIQIATKLPTDKLYGFGENTHQTLKHDFSKYKTWGMFARDEGPYSGQEDTKNLYGVHPFYMMIEQDNKAHGVLILNSNAQEVTTGPGPHLIYRTIGGILNIFFFPGPTPEEVIKQYQSLIGTPFLPPYWALGFQLSRYGYSGLNDVKNVVESNRNKQIPLEVVYADIDYMDRCMDFTTGSDWSEISEYVKYLHEQDMKMILIFDPAIDVTSSAFKRAINANVSFIEYPRKDMAEGTATEMYESTRNTKIMLSVVWPYHHTAFPDFFDPDDITQRWWIDELKNYHNQIPFDGIWIDMNEPAAFGTNEDNPWYLSSERNLTSLKCNEFEEAYAVYDDPPYKTHSAYRYGSDVLLSQKTLCMLGRTHRGKEIFYNTKNLYGLYETIATYKAAKEIFNERPVIITRSTFPSSGRYAGHWLGDNTATMNDLKTSVIGVMEFNLFGIPYVGSDVCGFNNEASEELCLRWQQVGAFHPFFRNHNNNVSPHQDPAHWDSVAAATRTANLFRYSYLSYLYSLHFEASLYGGTVIRPMFFEFVNDQQTHNINYQFMWGNSMLIAPVVEEGKTCIPVYLPSECSWYSLRDDDYGALVKTSSCVSATTTQLIPVFIRGKL